MHKYRKLFKYTSRIPTSKKMAINKKLKKSKNDSFATHATTGRRKKTYMHINMKDKS